MIFCNRVGNGSLGHGVNGLDGSHFHMGRRGSGSEVSIAWVEVRLVCTELCRPNCAILTYFTSGSVGHKDRKSLVRWVTWVVGRCRRPISNSVLQCSWSFLNINRDTSPVSKLNIWPRPVRPNQKYCDVSTRWGLYTFYTSNWGGSGGDLRRLWCQPNFTFAIHWSITVG